jgi:hypothetical protein
VGRLAALTHQLNGWSLGRWVVPPVCVETFAFSRCTVVLQVYGHIDVETVAESRGESGEQLGTACAADLAGVMRRATSGEGAALKQKSNGWSLARCGLHLADTCVGARVC